MIHEASVVGVGGYVGSLAFEIFCIADAVFLEVGLPDFSGELLADSVREAALDALGATFDGLLIGGGE